MTVGDGVHGVFDPDRAAFPHLPHPPFSIMGLNGMALFGFNYHDLLLEGLIGGQVVAEQRISSEGLPFALTLDADDAAIVADGADLTRLVLRITDRFGNRLPYDTTVVTFEVEGPARLIGANPLALIGGQAAVYVGQTETPGTVTVTARAPRLPEARVVIEVQPAPTVLI